MRVGVLQLYIDLPGVQSLKEKRGLVKRILHQTRKKFFSSAAEVDQHDYCQSAGLGFSLVGNSAPNLQSRLHKIVDFVDQTGLGVVVDFHIEVL
ncbi:DUF503 domain-containing protein [Magnetococcales bacterium HHB-1]